MTNVDAAGESGAPRTSGLVVAIDGPAGSGKSTLARSLASALGLPYLNTGLMYRAVARAAIERSVAADDEAGLTELASSMRFDLDADPTVRRGTDEPGTSEPPRSLLIDGVQPDDSLSAPAVEAIVSAVARHPGLRKVLRAEQRRLGSVGCVAEGRDIGMVVFPEADVKIFLAASPDVRTARRAKERAAPKFGAVEEALTKRDVLDARTNPLEPASDALVLDTSNMSRDETLRQALELVNARLRGLGSAGHPAELGGRMVRETRDRHRAGGTGGPLVAVIGRQNVGKSTLVNRLVGRREAIAHETPGVTRDRVEFAVRWNDRSFRLVDTGGFVERARGIDEQVAEQAVRAMGDADAILIVVDAQTGPQEEDARLARRLRRSDRPILLVANKVDSTHQEPSAADFHKLGLGEPLPVSALNGRGTGELLDRIVAVLPERIQLEVEGESDGEARFALVGRPNVGKSSLFNRLLQDERAVVHEQAGTTRDAVDSLVEVEGRMVRFVDTAGFRRPLKTQGIEYYGLLRSLRAIDLAHVALLVLEAPDGLTGEDKRVAARVVEAGRGLAVALNKWDLVPSIERDQLFKSLTRELQLFPGTPVLRTSALRGVGVGRIVPALLMVHASWTRRVPTAEVNRVLQAALETYPPPRGVGRIRYATQVSAGPPSFVLFGTVDPPTAYRRYLENSLRRAFGFGGVPLRLSFRPRQPRGGPAPGR